MPTSPDIVTRRRAIQSLGVATLVVLGAAALYPGSGGSPDVPAPAPSEPVAQPWRDFVIPATDASIEINPTGAEQRPLIGLKELYIITSGKVPFIAIGGVFDRMTNQSQKDLVAGLTAFQPVNTPFSPRPVTFRPLAVSENEAEDVVLFTGDAAYQLKDRTQGRIMKDPAMFDIVRRPEAGARFALVLGQGITQFRQTPSPLSYVSVSFEFEKLKGNPVKPGSII